MGTLCKLLATAPCHARSRARRLAGGSRTAIKEILENPSAYPLIEEQENNILIVNQKSGQLNFTAGHGLGDWVTNRLASGAIITAMLAMATMI